MQVCIPVLLVAKQERMVETIGCTFSVSICVTVNVTEDLHL